MKHLFDKNSQVQKISITKIVLELNGLNVLYFGNVQNC